MTQTSQILVIDPAMKVAETESYNFVSLTAPLKTTYHLPAMYGLDSLHAVDMSQVKGIVIFGSACSVYERLPWQEPFENWLRPHLSAGIPTLGICYGHQMLAHMFGGKVGYVFPDQKKIVGFRDINISQLPWFAQQTGPVVVSHNEMVQEIPEEFALIASSDQCFSDGMAHKHLPIWSLQSHPEATTGFLRNHDIDVETHKNSLKFGQNFVRSFLTFAANLSPR